MDTILKKSVTLSFSQTGRGEQGAERQRKGSGKAAFCPNTPVGTAALGLSSRAQLDRQSLDELRSAALLARTASPPSLACRSSHAEKDILDNLHAARCAG
jgi:hypothetical protein